MRTIEGLDKNRRHWALVALAVAIPSSLLNLCAAGEQRYGPGVSDTEIKIGQDTRSVNEQTKKIYICPFSGKVFGDNTHPNPQDAIYDWVSTCAENNERVGGLRVKRFFVSEDPEMIQQTKEFAKSRGISKENYEFQMLYGIRRDLQEKLVTEGHKVRIYVPFGTQWYGYIMRRLAERPANLWFVMKNLVHK